MYGPRIELEYERKEDLYRVVLQSPRDETEAAAKFAEWFSDNRTLQYLSLVSPVTLSGERKWIEKQAESENQWIWHISVNEKLVGSIGLHRVNIVSARAELGIAIGDKEHWGKGVATVAEIAVIEYGFGNIVPGGLHKIHARVLSGNVASQKVIAEKVGMREVGVKKEEHWKNGKWYDEWSGELLASDWREMREERMRQAGITKLDLYPGCE